MPNRVRKSPWKEKRLAASVASRGRSGSFTLPFSVIRSLTQLPISGRRTSSPPITVGQGHGRAFQFSNLSFCDPQQASPYLAPTPRVKGSSTSDLQHMSPYLSTIRGFLCGA